MLSHIQRTIDELKQKVSYNVSLINTNQSVIKSMAGQVDEYAGQCEIFIEENRILLAQNNDLINVQLTLINFLEKYKETAVLEEHKPVVDIYSVTDIQEVFTLTTKGIIPFDENHPHFKSIGFIEKLLVYYGGKEDYEMCQRLIEIKENLIIP